MAQVQSVRRRSMAGGLCLLALLAGCQGVSRLAFWTWGKQAAYGGDVVQLLSAIHERYQALQSCQLEYEVRVTENGTTRDRWGTAWVRGTGVRLEEEVSFAPLRGASEEVRVSDGRETWVYRPTDAVATVQPVSPQTQKRLADQVAEWGPLSQVLDVPAPGPNVHVEEVASRGGKRLRIESSQGSPGGREPWFRRVVLVDARDFTLQEMEEQGARLEDGRLIEYTRLHRYWGYQLNLELSDDLFRFALPEKTRVERLPPR